MASLGKLWAGSVYGTNTGKLAAELVSEGADVTGLLRFMDEQFGLVVYKLVGQFDGTSLELTGTAEQAPEGITTGDITVKAALGPKGELRGPWTSTLGTGGTFILYPHDAPTQPTTQPGAPPERIHTARRAIGALVLDSDDVVELIGFLARDFSVPASRVIVTYQERGTETSQYAADFAANYARLGEKKYLKLFIQEPDAYGINKAAVIELSDSAHNEVRVEGVQESWVLGKAEALAAKLRQHQRMFMTTVRRVGLNVTTLLVVGAAVMLPELSLSRRVAFVACIWALVWIVIRLHARLVPNAVIYLSERKPTFIQKTWPQIISFLIGLASSVAAAIAYGLLSGDLTASHFAWLGLSQ